MLLLVYDHIEVVLKRNSRDTIHVPALKKMIKFVQDIDFFNQQ